MTTPNGRTLIDASLALADYDQLNADLAQFLGLWDEDDTPTLAEINAVLSEVAL